MDISGDTEGCDDASWREKKEENTAGRQIGRRERTAGNAAELFSPKQYEDIDKLHQENHALVRQEIERMKKEYEQQHNHDIKCG